MALKTICPGCGVRASLMLYLSLMFFNGATGCGVFGIHRLIFCPECCMFVNKIFGFWLLIQVYITNKYIFYIIPYKVKEKYTRMNMFEGLDLSKLMQVVALGSVTIFTQNINKI